MNYRSTRDSSISVGASQTIVRGISAEGGLFVPESLPWLSYNDLKRLTESDYVTRASEILGMFLGDFSHAEVLSCVSGAYTRDRFETDSIAPLYELRGGTFMLELWHGPTCAFKDMALQLLPRLMAVAAEKDGGGKTIVIPVATSGDTGKAALEGFKNVKGTKILAFYPEQGVSPMQKLQMTTQEGGNVFVCAIRGNFDDAQAGVKEIFTDNGVLKDLAAHNMVFSSANSINWGRLAPQIVYYVSAYCDLVKNNRIACGEHVNIVVPTGNFGNILAAYYAKKMGIPVNKLICASNANNVLTDFLKTGVYDRNRPFFTTISPSMDILVSSNLERLIYDLSGCSDEKTRGYMRSLAQTGAYEVEDSVKNSLRELFWSGCCDDAQTRGTIGDVYSRYNYVCDPHTAVAVNVYGQYREQTQDDSKTIIASTASPFKFARDVLEAINGERPGAGEQELLQQLSTLAMTPAPRQILSLFDKFVRFTETCEKPQMRDTIYRALGI